MLLFNLNARIRFLVPADESDVSDILLTSRCYSDCLDSAAAFFSLKMYGVMLVLFGKD
jgi:hypothetical protein